MHPHVAIDGPVASGKTTVALMLARMLDMLYLDTGAMYRAVAFLALADGVNLESETSVLALMREVPIRIEAARDIERGYRIFGGDRELGDELFGREISSIVSITAAFPAVRALLTERQREISRQGPVVMAGRDIGTVVLPDAPVKIFLTASVDARVKRRLDEFASKGSVMNPERLRAQIEERDRLDQTRTVAPLRPAPDAFTIDSSTLDPQEVVALIADRVASYSV